MQYTPGYRGLQVRIIQNDVGGLATQLLGNTLDRRRSVLGHQGTGPGRTGEGHHVDIGVHGQGRAHGRSVTIDQVEYTRGNARFMQYLGVNVG